MMVLVWKQSSSTSPSFVKHMQMSDAIQSILLVMLYRCTVVPCDRGGNKWLCTTQQADPSTGAEAAGRQLSYPSPKAVKALRWSLPSRVTPMRCVKCAAAMISVQVIPTNHRPVARHCPHHWGMPSQQLQASFQPVKHHVSDRCSVSWLCLQPPHPCLT